MRRKIFAVTTATIMALSLAACSKSTNTETPTTSTTEAVTTVAETTTQAETTTTEAETTTTEPETTTEAETTMEATTEWDLSDVQLEGDGVYNRYFWDILESYVGRDMTSGQEGAYTAYANTIYLYEELVCRASAIPCDGFAWSLEEKYGSDMEDYELPIPRSELVKIVAAKFNLDPVMVDKAFFTLETQNDFIINEEGLSEDHNFMLEDGYTGEELYGGPDTCITFKIW